MGFFSSTCDILCPSGSTFDFSELVFYGFGINSVDFKNGEGILVFVGFCIF